MANEVTQSPDPTASAAADAPPAPAKTKPVADAVPPTPSPDAPRRFRVLHAAVSGIGKNRKGETQDVDYLAGRIVTAEQLEHNEAHYLIMGAIEEVIESAPSDPE